MCFGSEVTHDAPMQADGRFPVWLLEPELTGSEGDRYVVKAMSVHVLGAHPAPSMIRGLEGRGAAAVEGDYLR